MTTSTSNNGRRVVLTRGYVSVRGLRVFAVLWLLLVGVAVAFSVLQRLRFSAFEESDFISFVQEEANLVEVRDIAISNTEALVSVSEALVGFTVFALVTGSLGLLLLFAVGQKE